MTILIDPAISGDELRQQLVAGNLVILTRLQALNDFVEYTRDGNQLRGQTGVRALSGVQACPARALRMACMGGTALSLMVIR